MLPHKPLTLIFQIPSKTALLGIVRPTNNVLTVTAEADKPPDQNFLITKVIPGESA